MKISPVAGPGQALGNVDVGRAVNPVKMERARAIARGEMVTQEQEEVEAAPAAQDIRRIKMQTNRTTQQPELTESSKTLPIEEPVVDEATKPLSPQFAALAKQKRAIQVKEMELKKREDALAAGGTKDGSPELIAKLKSNPLSVLQEHGVTYDQLTEAILADGGINPELQALKDELKTLKGDVEKTFTTKEEQAEESALTEMLYEAEALAKEGDAFEMIREQNAYDRVLRLIHSTYKKTGRVLDTTDAMNRIETQLLKDAEKLARIKKVQDRMAPPSQPPLQRQPKQMTTLTARDSTAGTMSAKARALAAFAGTLRK
jgi:hypothetical protein